jgi:signal transduction histidine kinase
MLPANKTPDPVEDAALYQRCFERERRARQQAEAVLEAKSLDLFMQHQELLQVNSTLEQRIAARTAELAEAVKQAEKASTTKSEFLAKMSHEIRTPMNGVLGMLEALNVTRLDDKQKELLKVARDSADTLLALINDILDFSKIEAGRMSIESINFDLVNLLENIIQLWTPRATEKNLQLTMQIDRDTPRWLVGDPTRLSQIITNLVSNALKFTSMGQISIQCDMLTPEEMDPCMLRFAVQDTGVGMNPDVCRRLFTAFEQADGAATTRVYGGTGLGLAICKQLAQLMDGEISVESTPGSGSCFMLQQPPNSVLQ